MRKPAAFNVASASGVLCLTGVRYCQQAGQLTIYRQIHHACTLAAQGFRLRNHGGDGRANLLHQGRVAQRKLMSAHLPLHADAGGRVKVVGLVECHITFAGGPHDCFCQRMLTALVQAGGQAQHFVGFNARCGNGAIK